MPPDFASNPLSAINCIFEGKFDAGYNMAEGCWDTLDEAVTYYSYSNINILAVRDVNNGEELLISYEKPEPPIQESSSYSYSCYVNCLLFLLRK